MDHDILAQPGRVDLAALEGEGHAGFPPDIFELSLVRIQVRCEQLVALHVHPHTRHLRAAVRVGRHQMAERARPDQLLGALRKVHTATESTPDTGSLGLTREDAYEF